MTAPVPVLLMTRELGPGGSERQLTAAALSLDRTRFTPHVACFRPGGVRYEELIGAGVPVVEIPVRSFRSPSTFLAALKFRRYVREHRIQIVHAFDVPSDVFAVPLARLFGVPVVLSSQRAHRELTPGLMHRLLRLTDRLAHGVVVNSQFMRRHLIEDEGVPADKVHVCYNGIDTSVFNPGDRAKLPALAHATLVIGTVCVLRPEKDLPTLIRAFAALAPLERGYVLAIVGSGPERDRLEALAAELGVRQACHFEPATADVVPWYRSIDIFVLPSLSEAFSNSLLEAMACGCCCVASRVGGNEETAIPAMSGLLFAPGGTLELAGLLTTMAGDSDQGRAMGMAASRFVGERFAVHRMAGQLNDLYRRRATTEVRRQR